MTKTQQLTAYGLTLLLVACRPLEPLSRVPILGGSAEQQQIVRDELEGFDQAVGVGRVRLRMVQLESAPVETSGTSRYVVGGEYFISRKVIHLDTSSTPDQLARIVRHELCHALAHQDDLTQDGDMTPLPPLDEIRPTPLDLNPDEFSTFDERLDEAFAVLCEVGPEATLALSQRCGSDALDLSEAAEWINQAVYDSDALLPMSTSIDPDRAFDMSGPWTWISSGTGPPSEIDVLAGTVDGVSAFEFKLSGAPSDWIIAGPFDIQSGAPLDGRQEAFILGDADAVDPQSFGSLVVHTAAEAGTGVSVALASVGVGELPVYRRMLVASDGPWRLATTCPMGVDDVAALDDQLWYSWVDENVSVHWATINQGDTDAK